MRVTRERTSAVWQLVRKRIAVGGCDAVLAKVVLECEERWGWDVFVTRWCRAHVQPEQGRSCSFSSSKQQEGCKQGRTCARVWRSKSKVKQSRRRHCAAPACSARSQGASNLGSHFIHERNASCSHGHVMTCLPNATACHTHACFVGQQRSTAAAPAVARHTHNCCTARAALQDLHTHMAKALPALTQRISTLRQRCGRNQDTPEPPSKRHGGASVLTERSRARGAPANSRAPQGGHKRANVRLAGQQGRRSRCGSPHLWCMQRQVAGAAPEMLELPSQSQCVCVRTVCARLPRHP